MTPEEKGIQLMADMGTKISEVAGKTMPSDSAITNALKEVAEAVDDYTEKAAQAVQDMADALLSAVKGAIQVAISKDPPEQPSPESIQAAIYQAILDADPNKP